MPTARGWAAIGVSAALLVLWIGFGEVELMTTAAFLIAAVLTGTVFVRMTSPRITIDRRIYPLQVHEGDHVTVEIDIASRRRQRNLFIEDVVHGLGVARFAAASTSPTQPLVARYEVHCRSRGAYQVGPAAASVSDAFGLSETKNLTGSADRLVVYPRVETLAGFPAVRGVDSTVQTTRPTFAPHGGEDFFTLREYQVGDDLRKVHWPSSAKRDLLMIKQLEIPWQARALVLLDTRSDRYPTAEAFEQAVKGAASAVAHLYKGGFSPELWTTDRAMGPRTGNRYRQAMEALATVQPERNVDLQRTVSRMRRQGAGGGALILVTGTPDEGALAAFRVVGPDFTKSIVMIVADPAADGAGSFSHIGASTVVTRPGGSWAPSWRTAMELSWSTASAG